MTATKANLIESIAEANGYSQAKARKITESMLEIIKSTLENGEDVLISGFGKFCVNEKGERLGRDPSTGQELMLRPRKVVTFKCSGKLRTQINNG